MSDDRIAFAGHTCVASGSLIHVAQEVKALLDTQPTTVVLILDAVTSEPVEVDFRGTPEDVVARLPEAPVCGSAPAGATPPVGAPPPADEASTQPAQSRAPGRPRLGVVAREVTLLPRHWEWLCEQPGGASVTLRKLVEEARRSTVGEARIRRAREACYRFMNTVAGNEPGYEEALRALFADDRATFDSLVEDWPPDVRDHVRRLATECFTGQAQELDQKLAPAAPILDSTLPFSEIT
jgi:uncharacterized protein